MSGPKDRPPGPHLLLGSDGSVFIDVRTLGPVLAAKIRHRRTFVAVQLKEEEASLALQVMNQTGAANAVVAVRQELSTGWGRS